MRESGLGGGDDWLLTGISFYTRTTPRCSIRSSRLSTSCSISSLSTPSYCLRGSATMAATLCFPSSCARMSRAGPCSFRVPSGISMTASVGCKRQPGASLGVAFKSISAFFRLGDEASRRYVAGYHVSVVDCVQLRPQDRAFPFQCPYHLFLLCPCRCVGADIIQGERGVFRRLRQATLKVA